MGLFSIIGKAIQAGVNEAKTPQTFKTGQHFEDYVREYLFIDKYYVLLEKTHDYNTNSKDFVESSLKPDYTFRDRQTKREFYLEVKFRTGLYDGKISWCNDNQLKRYREYDKSKPVFVIIGMGEEPKLPGLLYLMPLKAAKYTGLFPSYVDQFEIILDKPVSSKALWER